MSLENWLASGRLFKVYTRFKNKEKFYDLSSGKNSADPLTKVFLGDYTLKDLEPMILELEKNVPDDIKEYRKKFEMGKRPYYLAPYTIKALKEKACKKI